MKATLLPPAEAAGVLFSLTKGKPDIAAIERGYLTSAREMREYASRAATHRTGKYRGYSELDALRMAEENDRRAISVPAELRKLAACGC